MTQYIICYKHKTANGATVTRSYATTSQRDYERVMMLFETKPDEYTLVGVEVKEGKRK